MRSLAVSFISLFVWIAVVAPGLAETNDLLVSKQDLQDPLRLGNNLSYWIAITNSGPDSATNVIVTDVLPADVDFVSCTPSQGTYSNDQGTIECKLGTLANGSTAVVWIVVTPTSSGVITNEVSISGDTGLANNRAQEDTTIDPANHPPSIALPGPHILPVGSTTSFVVTVSDPDHDPVTLTNTVAPAGATFINSNFTWTAGSANAGTTSAVVFVADDQQGDTNSVVTNMTTITVPFDWDSDSMNDDWEWDNFNSLTNTQSGDYDGDGANNYEEYLSGTEPTNINSRFIVNGVTNGAGTTNHEVSVETTPGRQYTIEYTDDNLSGAVVWSTFANTNSGFGIWMETNTSVSAYCFVDDEGTNTTSGTPVNGIRYYRLKVEVP